MVWAQAPVHPIITKAPYLYTWFIDTLPLLHIELRRRCPFLTLLFPQMSRSTLPTRAAHVAARAPSTSSALWSSNATTGEASGFCGRGSLRPEDPLKVGDGVRGRGHFIMRPGWLIAERWGGGA